MFLVLNCEQTFPECSVTLGWTDNDGIFSIRLNLFPNSSSFIFFPPQNSDPLSVARQQPVIINAAVCVGYLEVVPHIETKRSRGMWMKWSKNSRVEIGFGVGVWMVFQGSLPHMLSTVARRMLQMNEIKERMINETTAWPDVSLLNISPLLIFPLSVTVYEAWGHNTSFFMAPATHTHTHSSLEMNRSH